VTIGLAHAELIAVVTAITTDEPRVMTVREGAALPSGPFEFGHRTLQSGLREWIHEQTHHPVGYLEQLYTFADRDRNNEILGGRTISIGYLGLVREQEAPSGKSAFWHGWYEYFPWEDHRQGRPDILDSIIDRVRAWADSERLAAEILTDQAWRKDSTGGATNYHAASVSPDWAPNGRSIAFGSAAPRLGSSIYTIKPNGKGVRRVGRSHFPNNDFQSVYSPDGKRFAFNSDRRYKNFCCVDLFTMGLKGGRQRLVNRSFRNHGILNPVWESLPR